MENLKEDILITKILLMACTDYFNRVYIPWRPSNYKIFNKIVSPYKQLYVDLSKRLFVSFRNFFAEKKSKKIKIEELIKEANNTIEYPRDLLKRAGAVLRESLERVEEFSQIKFLLDSLVKKEMDLDLVWED